MAVETFQSIATQIAPLTEQVCLHLLGEPLLYPELEKLVAICSSVQLPIFLVSNGLLIGEKHQELILHPIFRQVCFSLHSFSDNFPDKDPHNYLNRIFHFTDTALEKRPDLYINFRLWNLQNPNMHADLNTRMLDAILQRYQASNEPISNIDVTKKKSFRLQQRLYLHFDTEFVWPSLDLPRINTKGTCYGLSNHFGILTDGTVVPCCLDKDGIIPLGNIHEESIAHILDKPKSKSILYGFQRYELVEDLCKRCPYIERFAPPSP